MIERYFQGQEYFQLWVTFPISFLKAIKMLTYIQIFHRRVTCLWELSSPKVPHQTQWPITIDGQRQFGVEYNDCTQLVAWVRIAVCCLVQYWPKAYGQWLVKISVKSISLFLSCIIIIESFIVIECCIVPSKLPGRVGSSGPVCPLKVL